MGTCVQSPERLKRREMIFEDGKELDIESKVAQNGAMGIQGRDNRRVAS